MGWTPWKISYASNYFDKLHALAIQLIKAGKAFVCHQVGVACWCLLLRLASICVVSPSLLPHPQTKAAIETSREAGTPSPWHGRSIEENLKLFDDTLFSAALSSSFRSDCPAWRSDCPACRSNRPVWVLCGHSIPIDT
jgi:hypothetical protein